MQKRFAPRPFLPPPACRGSVRRGAALVVVLGLLAVLMLMAVAFAVAMRTERGGSSNLRHSTVARAMLDTALARVLQDLDDELGTEPAPPWMVYASTNRFDPATGKNEHRPAGVLSYEAAQCLPPDQLLAARAANPGWLPVVASVGLGANDAVVAGRYAYVVLNNTGYLDANLVGGAPARSNGLSAAEIRLRDSADDKYGIAATLNAAGAGKFVDRRVEHGRYSSGSEFFRLTPKVLFDQTPNPDGSLTMVLGDETKFSTNSFAWDSLALESYAPATNSPSAYAARSPKFHIAKGSLTGSKAQADKIKATFESSFDPARGSKKTAGGTESQLMCDVVSGPAATRTPIPQSEVATAALYDYVDGDLLSNRDGSGTPYPISSVHWSALPCAEPVPLFDGFRAICHSYAETTTPTSTVYSLSVFMSYNTVFLNRIVPEAVRGKAFDLSVKLIRVSCDSGSGAFRTRFNTAVAAWNGYERKGTHAFNNDATVSESGVNNERCVIIEFDETGPLSKIEFEILNTVPFPDTFDVTLELLATVKLEGKVIQVVPAQLNDDETTWGATAPTRLALNFPWVREDLRKMLKPDGPRAGTLFWAYPLDPRFGYGNGQTDRPVLWLNRQLALGLANYGVVPALATELLRLGELFTPDVHDVRAGYGYGLPHVNPYRAFMMSKSTPKVFTGDGSPPGVGLTDWSDELYHSKRKDATRDDNVDHVDRLSDSALCMVRNGYPESVGELGNLILAPLRTVALFDGTHPLDPNLVVPRHTVLDWFTVHAPRADTPYLKTAALSGKVNLNPPFTRDGDGRSDVNPNTEPLTAVFAELPLNEWALPGNQKPISWEIASDIATVLLDDVLWWESTPAAPNAHIQHFNNRGGVAYDLSVLGRTPLDGTTLDRDRRLDVRLTTLTAAMGGGKQPRCDFEREALIRNSVQLLTTRQQIFTVVLRADAFTPKFGFSNAGEGTTLSTAHAIAEIWRDPEPLRDANGEVVRFTVAGDDGTAETQYGRPIHPWFIRYLHQF